MAGKHTETAWSKSSHSRGATAFVSCQVWEILHSYPSQKKDRIEKGSCHDLDQVLMGLDKKLIIKKVGYNAIPAKQWTIFNSDVTND